MRECEPPFFSSTSAVTCQKSDETPVYTYLGGIIKRPLLGKTVASGFYVYVLLFKSDGGIGEKSERRWRGKICTPPAHTHTHTHTCTPTKQSPTHSLDACTICLVR